MTFVNEYVSDEDIEKYDLNGLWNRYFPRRKGQPFLGNRPGWTIDRERNIYLLAIEQGINEHGNRTTFILWWDGVQLLAKLDLVEGSSGKFDEVPFVVVWALFSITRPESCKVAREDIIQALKEALATYGYFGVKRQIPNTVVEFKF